jgi:hypothetical protein
MEALVFAQPLLEVECFMLAAAVVVEMLLAV